MSASAGRVLIKPRGVYNSGTAYEMLDSVFFNGSSYICLKDSLGHAPTDSEYWQIFAQGAGVIAGAFVGACDSLGSAQVKSVIIPPADNFALQKGVIVGVRFTNTNTFEATSENSIALNVNNTGALPIYFGGTATPLGSNIVAFGEAGYTHFYQYDGTNWVFIGRSGVQTAEQTPLETPISVGGVSKANVEETLGALNTKESNEVAAIVNVYGSKNLLTYPYEDTTKSTNGIVYTDNGDGTISTNSATATSSANFWLNDYTQNIVMSLPAGTYKLTGCPSGGAQNKFWLRVEAYNSNNENVVYEYDYGNGVEFTTTEETKLKTVFHIEGGVTVSAMTIKPMIRDARISDPTFAPFAMTNRELTESVVPIDISALFTPTAANIQSSVVKAYRIGKIIDVNIRATLTSGLTTLKELTFYTFNNLKISEFYVNAVVVENWTSGTSKTMAQLIRVEPTRIYCPNEGGHALGFTTTGYSWLNLHFIAIIND